MIIGQIRDFSNLRYKIRAYICYLFTRNLPNYLPNANKDLIESGFEKIAHEIDSFEAFYILNDSGVQIENNISLNENYKTGIGENRSNKAYFYRTVKEKRFTLSDPYPSVLTNDLCVTAAYPIYNENKDLKFVACVDISLKDALKLTNFSKIDIYFANLFKFFYGIISTALFIVAMMLFSLGIKSLVLKSLDDLNVEDMFSSTIVLTLALAIMDLVKALVEAEILEKGDKKNDGNKTMLRFIVSIIIALAIEALMLVFKFAITAPEHIIFAVYLICGVSLLIISLGIYTYVVKRREVDWDY